VVEEKEQEQKKKMAEIGAAQKNLRAAENGL